MVYNSLEVITMFFQSKKKKIASCLAGLSQRTAFDMLLQEYLDGALADKLGRIGITKLEIHIDWLPDYRCIGIQGRFGKYYVDIQIEPEEFTVAVDESEPDEPAVYLLESAESFYKTVASFLFRSTL